MWRLTGVDFASVQRILWKQAYVLHLEALKSEESHVLHKMPTLQKVLTCLYACFFGSEKLSLSFGLPSSKQKCGGRWGTVRQALSSLYAGVSACCWWVRIRSDESPIMHIHTKWCHIWQTDIVQIRGPKSRWITMNVEQIWCIPWPDLNEPGANALAHGENVESSNHWNSKKSHHLWDPQH